MSPGGPSLTLPCWKSWRRSTGWRSQTCFTAAAPRQQRLRLLRRLTLGFAVTVLGLLLLRSAVRLWANTFLAFPDGTIITEATKPLLEQRFAIGDFCEGLESLAGTVSLLAVSFWGPSWPL